MIKAEDAFNLLDEIVAQFGPDYENTYRNERDTCQYWHGDGPSCIVGHVLWRSGRFTIQEIEKLDNPSTNAEDLALRFPDRVSPEAARVLENAQVVQDSGSSWGRAVRIAREAHQSRTEGNEND